QTRGRRRVGGDGKGGGARRGRVSRRARSGPAGGARRLREAGGGTPCSGRDRVEAEKERRIGAREALSGVFARERSAPCGNGTWIVGGSAGRRARCWWGLRGRRRAAPRRRGIARGRWGT